ncbi:MAG TPA: hypothetical protein VK391_00115 [Allosphingosinicella sp.]|nr:hypothetical protein [Allosphingosinicella sp.]
MLSAASAAAQPANDKGIGYLAEAARKFAVVPKCEPGPAGEILVCGRRNEEKYRLPIRAQGFDASGPADSVSRERHRLIQEGSSGVGSCSTSGPGGWTGCFHEQTKRRCQQKPCGVAF